MKVFHKLVIVIILCVLTYQFCPGEETSDVSKKDTRNLNFFDRTIDLQKRIAPIDRMIDLVPGLFPQLAEPS
ncbi:MAG: hypothetical protein ABIL22_09595, partial [candidate division WOR-3 bacterium]